MFRNKVKDAEVEPGLIKNSTYAASCDKCVVFYWIFAFVMIMIIKINDPRGRGLLLGVA